MGKGKAPVEGWVAVVKPDRVMFEMNGVSVDVAKAAMKLAARKLPIKCRFVVKEKPVAGAAEKTKPAKPVFEKAVKVETPVSGEEKE